MTFRTFTALRDPLWQQQDEEGDKAFQRFRRYRDQLDPKQPSSEDNTGDDGERLKERSIPTLAESLRRDPATIRQQARAHRWEKRAAAYDEHLRVEAQREHDKRMAEQAAKLAEAQIGAGLEAVHLVRLTLRDQISSGERLDVGEIPRLADAAVKLGQAAQKAPESVRAVYREARSAGGDGAAGSNVQAWEVEIPELAGLAPDAARDRITELVSSMSRLQAYQQRENGGAAE